MSIIKFQGSITLDIESKLPDILSVKPDIVISVMGGNDPIMGIDVSESGVNSEKITESTAWQQPINIHVPVDLKFRKINPTRYVVDVKGAKGSFVLVFSDSFNEGWKAYARQGQGTMNKEQRDEPWSALWSAWKDRENRREVTDHFVVNGYANGWIVPVEQFRVSGSEFRVQDKNWEDFQIVLEYKPQRLFEVGVILSGTTLLGCIGYIGYGFVRRRKKV